MTPPASASRERRAWRTASCRPSQGRPGHPGLPGLLGDGRVFPADLAVATLRFTALRDAAAEFAWIGTPPW